MRKHNKYSVQDIQPGDLIYFDDTPHQSNYDEYWEVENVNEVSGEIKIKLNYLYEDHFWTLHCSDIRQKLPVQVLQKSH